MLVWKTEPKKKKRKYSYVLKFPSLRAEKQTGWQEGTMDLDKMDRALEAARATVPRSR